MCVLIHKHVGVTQTGKSEFKFQRILSYNGLVTVLMARENVHDVVFFYPGGKGVFSPEYRKKLTAAKTRRYPVFYPKGGFSPRNRRKILLQEARMYSFYPRRGGFFAVRKNING